MSTLYEELQQLAKLHQDGVLSDAEFSQAKARAMEHGEDHTANGGGFVRLGRAALKLQTIWAIVVIALMLAFFFGFFLPTWNSFDRKFDEDRARFEQDFNRHWQTGR